MPWARVDDDACEHRKFKRAGLEATGLYWMCVSYSARYLTDGHVDFDYVRDRVPSKAKRQRLLTALLDNDLFEQNGSGYVIHDYLDRNPSREQALEKKAKEAEKKRKQRMSPGDSVGVSTDEW